LKLGDVQCMRMHIYAQRGVQKFSYGVKPWSADGNPQRASCYKDASNDARANFSIFYILCV